MKMTHVRYGLLVALLGLLLAPGVVAQPYSQIYVFGESIVDQGNAKDLFFSYFGVEYPPSPPYAGGRYCNGPEFPEVVADNLGLEPIDASSAGGPNYSFGFARSVVENLVLGIVPIPSVRTQVETYLADVGGVADSEALYILQDGGNDTDFAVSAFSQGGMGTGGCNHGGIRTGRDRLGPDAG